MARKGNQQRNGVARNPSNYKIRVSESAGGPSPVKKVRVKASEGKIVEELPTDSHLEQGVLNPTYAVNERKDNQKSGNLPSKGKPVVDGMPGLAQSLSTSSNSRNPVGDASVLDVPRSKGETGALLGGNHGLKNQKVNLGLENGLPAEDMMKDSKSSDTAVGRSFGASALSALKVIRGWLERQKPLFNFLTTMLFDARDYVWFKTKQVYPVIWKWLVQFGKLFLLISMIWLDCSLRGLDSFLRLGTTSFFTVIWCSIVSVIAMIGFFKFLVVMAIAALVAVYVGFTLAVLLLIISAALLLWFYGSFWITGSIILVGGMAFALSHERLALLITTVYSIYCVKIYVGWFGLLLVLNLSFISSDILAYFLKNTMHEHTRSNRPEQDAGTQNRSDSFYGEPSRTSPSEAAFGRSSDRSAGLPSTSGADAELTSEDEVVRLLNCTDHYCALGFSRYENVDVSLLKREYRRKAMLVHPDKNMGNEKAAEAFKKLQNAYEVLLDSLKRKAYDDELRREEIMNCIRRFQSASQTSGRQGLFASGFTHSEADSEDLHGDSRRIACKKCGNFHIWIHTSKSKSRARWCQDCKDFHQAKDGDGWVEQSFQPIFFGLLQKVDAPSAYVCAESTIYDATEWFVCQVI
uniref:J domain-containing protein n=1 Tax=Nelumbo nucifera TaxID=4432 RepID=A0A822Z1F0_NELNU|nr:TPA_asm: hypothetical protein HUJ06_008984 [Nelumbo nucifera]